MSDYGSFGHYNHASTHHAGNHSRKRLCIIFSAFILLTILTISYFQKSTRPQSFHHASPSPSSPPGIGFHLTPSYAVSAARHANGTITPLTRIDLPTQNVLGTPETLLHMFQHLAEPKGYRDPFAGYCHEEGLNPFPTRRSLRKAARRLMGLPSTEDVGRLVDAIGPLKEQTEKALGHGFSEVYLTAPSFHQLCAVDLREAVEFVGLRPLMSEHEVHVFERSAAYAGYGLGICEHWENSTRCGEEMGELPTMWTMSVMYSNYVLMSYCIEMKTTEINQLLNPEYVLDWGAGQPYGFRTDLAREASEELIVVRLLESALAREQVVDRVILMGESAGGDWLKGLVGKAMKRFQEGNEPEVFVGDKVETEYVAAKGAAEFAWRSMQS